MPNQAHNGPQARQYSLLLRTALPAYKYDRRCHQLSGILLCRDWNELYDQEGRVMRYGLELPNADVWGNPRGLAELVHIAEEAGWDGVFLEDYIIYYAPGSTYDPWVILTAMALQTQRIRLGTTVTAVARRRPWKLARELTTLDHLSGGRMILGIGLGDEPDFTRFGERADPKWRAEQLDESLDILVGLWSGQPFSYRGKHFSLSEGTFLPPPVQSPRIPIWVGGSSQRRGPVQRAARWDGFLPVQIPLPQGVRHLTPEEVRAVKVSIEEQRTRSTPFDIALGGLERSVDWEAERVMIKALAEAGATWWMEWIPVAEMQVMRQAIERGPLRIN